MDMDLQEPIYTPADLLFYFISGLGLL